MCKLYLFEYRSRYFFRRGKQTSRITNHARKRESRFRVMKFGRYVTVDDGGDLCHVSVDASIY